MVILWRGADRGAPVQGGGSRHPPWSWTQSPFSSTSIGTGGRRNLIRTSIDDKNSGSTEITTRLDHISHCKTASGTNWSSTGWGEDTGDNAEEDKKPKVDFISKHL